jgi:hypothetical protein
MAGVLEDVVNVRTNGNGTLRSEWDDILLWRDLERLIAAGMVREITRADGIEGKWFLDCTTSEIYQYLPAWERGSARFERLKVDSSFDKSPASDSN